MSRGACRGGAGKLSNEAAMNRVLRAIRASLWGLLIVELMLGPLLAQEPVIPKLYYQDFADHSEIWAENQLAVDSTVSFFFKEMTNVSPDNPRPQCMTVKPGQKVRIAYLLPNDPGQPWRYDYEYHWMWGDMAARHDNTVVYRLPYASRTAHTCIQGWNTSFTHKGELSYAVDFDLAEGTPIHCARDGVVVFTEDRFSEGGLEERLWNRVNVVLVRHSDQTIGEYAHLKAGGVAVRVGQQVSAGDLLGYSGHTGYSKFPHLHFVIYRAVDGYGRESFPMTFATASGNVTPVEGASYTAP